jgi:hypothetical protein
MVDLTPRPTPVRDVAGTVATWAAGLGALVVSLTGFGILTAVQGDVLTGLLGAIPGVVAWISTAIAAFRVASKAQPLVTPISDPRANSGVRLIPEPRRT